MYEVFLNERRILLAEADDPWFLENPLKGLICEDLRSLSSAVLQFLESKDLISALSGNMEWMWPAFQSMFMLMPAAGGVVKSDKGYLFIFRRGCWDFPKGKIDENESPGEAAIREVQEETGLKDLTLTGELPSTWHIYRSPYKKTKGQWILKETKWFKMSTDGNLPLFPEKNEDIEEARWFLLSEFNIVLDNTYPNLKRLINILQKT